MNLETALKQPGKIIELFPALFNVQRFKP
ncbi:hypothetical protein D046_7401A, partial [Vibrio parahaemolyticus V-223/04]